MLTRCCLHQEALELGDQLGVPSQLELGVDPALERAQSQLLQPPNFALGEVLERDLGQRRPAPEREGLVKQAGGLGEIARLERPRPCMNAGVEFIGVSKDSPFTPPPVAATLTVHDSCDNAQTLRGPRGKARDRLAPGQVVRLVARPAMRQR